MDELSRPARTLPVPWPSASVTWMRLRTRPRTRGGAARWVPVIRPVAVAEDVHGQRDEQQPIAGLRDGCRRPEPAVGRDAPESHGDRGLRKAITRMYATAASSGGVPRVRPM